MSELNKTLIWQLGAAGFVSAADNWVVSPILPAIAYGLDISTFQAGVILTAYLIPYGLMQPIYGFMSDCVGKAKLLKGIVWGLAFGTLGCFAANSLWVLCFWRIVTGFFAAGIIAVSLALLGDTVTPSERQKYVGMFIGVVFLGQGVGAGLGGIVAEYINWRTIFAVLAALAACTALFLKGLPSGMACHTGKNFFAEVRQVALSNKGKVIFPLVFCAGFLLLGLYSYLGAFLHEVVRLNYLQVGVVIMLFGIACFLAGRQAGRLARKAGQKRTVVIGSFLAVFSAALLVLFPRWPGACLATISLGVSYIFIQSTLATIAFEVSSNSKGLPSGLIGLGLFCGGGLGTVFIGWLLSISSYLMVCLTVGTGFLLFKLAVERFLFTETADYIQQAKILE